MKKFIITVLFVMPLLSIAQNKIILKAPGGGGSGISSGRGINISSNVSNIDTTAHLHFTELTISAINGTLSTAAQPNITSLGTLSALTVSGSVRSGSFYGAGTGITGNASGLSIGGNANTATTATEAVSSIQVSSVAVSANTNYYLPLFLSPLSTNQAVLVSSVFTANPSTGTITATNLAGTLTTAAQPNITSIGTLSGLNVSGLVTTAKIAGGSATPSISAGSGAGTSPTVSIVGNDLAGEISIYTGSSPTSSADFCTVTFAAAYTGIPFVVFSNSSGEGVPFDIFYSVSTASSFRIRLKAGYTAAASTQYKISYHVMR